MIQQLVARFGNLSPVSATSCSNWRHVTGDKPLELVDTGDKLLDCDHNVGKVLPPLAECRLVECHLTEWNLVECRLAIGLFQLLPISGFQLF